MFVARFVNGVRTHRAAGIAATAITRSTSSKAAGRRGIRLRPAGTAPAAATNGAGPSVYAASAGRGMKSGMRIRIESKTRQTFYFAPKATKTKSVGRDTHSRSKSNSLNLTILALRGPASCTCSGFRAANLYRFSRFRKSLCRKTSARTQVLPKPALPNLF